MSCRGKVKSFNPSRGFGFISDRDGDTFLHEEHCEDGKQPQKGDIVFFDKIPGLGKSCRYEARNVTGGRGEPVQAPAQEQAMPHDQPQQRREHAAKTTAPPAGGDVPASGVPAAEALAAGDPSESSLLAERLAADHKDSPGDTSADSRKTACAGNFDSMHDAYREFGTEEYYRIHGERYTNPHEPVISRALVAALSGWAPRLELPLRRVHDLACGSGEASAAFSKIPSFAGCALDASDPYTNAAFEKRMGRPAYHWSFEDIAGGVLEDLQPYDLVIGSFSLHLLTKEWQHTSLSALARSCRMLVVLTPHKQPVIEASTGWRQLDEVVRERVRARLYISDAARRLGQGEAVEHTEHTIVCHPPPSSEGLAADDGLASKEPADISREISGMNHHELREALTKRGLSTAGKRGQWADRLLVAVQEAKDPKAGSEACPGMSAAGGRHEAEKSVGAEHVGEEVEEEEEESEDEGSSDEETTEDEDDSTLSQSTRDDEDEAAAAVAAKKAAVRAALKARQAAKRPGNRMPHVEKHIDASEAKKEQGTKPKKEVSFVDAAKVKDTRLQANFGQTKFIKP